MKGKGKGPHDKAEKEKDRDIKDCPLQFPDLTTIDHVKECPKYTQILARDQTAQQISLEELDQVQADIEILLASVGKRLKLVGIENQALSSLADKKEGKKSSNGKGSETPSQASTPTKRKGTPNSEDKDKDKEKQSSKKFKDGDGKASRPSTPTPRSKGKNSQSKGQSDDITASGDASSDPPKAQKNDAVNRFWASVEPFCSPIAADDLRVIEELLKSYAEESEYMKIPALGVHYTQRWAEEDLMEEQSDGTKISDKKRSSEPLNGTTNSEASSLLKKVQMKDSDYYMDDSPFGPLTQRLVSALIEDNLMTPIDDCMADTAECGQVPAVSPRAIAKQFNIGNPATLERRIRKELEEQGILEKEEEEEDDPNDEVLAELRKKQQELRAISQQNINILKSLYRQGQEDMVRQDLKKKLQAADSEVMDAYRKIQTARQRKKSPTKKEKDTITKVLKEREAILKALEAQ